MVYETMRLPKMESPLKGLSEAPEALYIQIVDRIRTWMRQGIAREGEMLPSERELASYFGVSRIPVREAIRTLEYLGIVRQLRGRGVIVNRVELPQVLNVIDFVAFEKTAVLQQVAEAQEALEVHAVGLAALRRTQEDIANLQRAITESELCISQGLNAYQGALLFHIGIVQAAHNPVTIKLHEYLQDFLFFMSRSTLRTSQMREASVRSHRAILSAIQAQDAEAAQAAMHAHLMDSLCRIPAPVHPDAKGKKAGKSGAPTSVSETRMNRVGKVDR